MKDDLQKELDNCDFLVHWKPSTSRGCYRCFRTRTFLKDEIIFSKGDQASNMFLIRSGRVKICVVDRQGVELFFTFLMKGDILGDLAVIDGKPRLATAIAVEYTDTIYLERQNFVKFLSPSPQACMNIILVLCQRLRRLSGQIKKLFFLDVAGRIARNMMEMEVIESALAVKSKLMICSIIQEELARVIASSREMVTKVLNSLVDPGLLYVTRKKLTILNLQELERIADYEMGD
jgi:CRP/FNR family transcriptional regulator, cyclic AMP receptor protein